MSTPACTSASDPATISVDTVSSREGIAVLEPLYGQLLESVGNTLPFTLHDWHSVWCRHFLNRNPHIEDQPLFQVLRDTSGECVGIVPFIVSRRRIGPLKIVAVALLGADPAITEIRSPILKPGYEFLAARAAQGSLDALVKQWDWVQWTGMSAEFADGLAAREQLRWQPVLKNYVLDLPGTWDEFRAGLKRNIRESLRHCYNSLTRDGHRFEFEVASSPAEVGDALDVFLALHEKRASMSGTVRHSNYFSNEPMRGFLKEICAAFAARGILRLFQLKVGKDTVAARIGFVVGDGLYLYYSGYDPAWAKYSVMTTTVAESIRYAIGEGLKSVDLATGTDVSKTRWGARVIEYREAYEENGRLKSQLVCHAYSKALSGEGIQGKLLKRLVPAVRRFWS